MDVSCGNISAVLTIFDHLADGYRRSEALSDALSLDYLFIVQPPDSLYFIANYDPFQ